MMGEKRRGDMSKFPAILKELRAERKISLSELSKLTGIDQGYLSRLERGEKSNPSAEVLSKLADALGVTTDFLLGRSFYLSDRRGGFSGFGRHYGKKATKKLIELRTIKTPDDLPKTIRHELQPPVLLYSVIQLLDNKPLAISRSYLPSSLPLDDLEKILGGVKKDPTLSLYKTLESLGKKPATCEEHLTAEMPSSDETSLLEISEGIPVIQITRRTFDTSSYLVECCLMTLRSDAHQLTYRFAL